MDSIESLIPQRAPIVMVDAFIRLEDNVSYTELTVREDNLFVDAGVMTECGVIEHVAQSAAARVGYICSQMNVPVPIGFIGSVSKFSIDRLPKSGEKMETSVTLIQKVFKISLIEASVKIASEEIARCRMKIFLDSDEDA